MKKHVINIVQDFSETPYGRYIVEVQKGEVDSTGERFRKEFLSPALHNYEKVHVVLTGYNRYAPSFIDEAFGGLISSGEFSFDQISQKLTYEHGDLPSIVELIESRINKAAQHRHG